MDLKTPRRMRRRVRAEKKPSTALSQEPDVRGEVEGPARVAGEPRFDLGVFVGGVVVDDGMDQLAGRDRALDGVEEADELLVGVPLHAAAEHGAVEHVEGGEQGGRAVPLVVVGHRAALAGLDRQAGLGAVERLDLRFLVDRQHDGMGRRVHVEADDVFDLLGEGGIVGSLEGAQPVRLQAVRLPDALDGAQRQADGLGHGPAGPMGRFAGRLAAGQRQDLGDRRRRQRLPAGLPRLVAQQPFDPGFGIALCQRHTAGRLVPARRATSSTGKRSAENRTIWARWTCFSGRFRSPMIAASRARSSALTMTQTSCAISAKLHSRVRFANQTSASMH